MMQSETLEAIKRSAAVPSMPLVATRCYELTKDPDCEYEDVVSLLGTDPGIAADVLRLANSALFGATRQIATLRQALTLLGLKRVRDLVLARYLVQRISEAHNDQIDINYYWRRSLTTAILAAKFADRLDAQHRDEAFIGGLLADVGVIVMSRALPRQYSPVAAHYRPHDTDAWIHGEYNLMGVSHGEVSALVLEQWNLPNDLVGAVRHHHTPPDNIPKSCEGALLARIIGGAGAIARLLCETTDPAAAADACLEALQRVNLDVSVLVNGLTDIEQEIESMAAVLRVDVINSKVFKLIGQKLAENLSAGCTA